MSLNIWKPGERQRIGNETIPSSIERYKQCFESLFTEFKYAPELLWSAYYYEQGYEFEVPDKTEWIEAEVDKLNNKRYAGLKFLGMMFHESITEQFNEGNFKKENESTILGYHVYNKNNDKCTYKFWESFMKTCIQYEAYTKKNTRNNKK